MTKVYLSTLVLMLSLSLISSTLSFSAKAASSDYVDATVKLNICGDGITEGEEECDNNDLKGKNCTDLDSGFHSGVLVCDTSCTFDTSDCSREINSNQANKLQALNQAQLTIGSNPTTIIDTLVNILTPSIPNALLRYDINNDGRISSLDIAQAAEAWVSSWNSQVADECDLNEDRTCDLTDFSILMYHAGE